MKATSARAGTPSMDECLEALGQALAPGYRRWKEAQLEQLRREQAAETSGTAAQRKGA